MSDAFLEVFSAFYMCVSVCVSDTVSQFVKILKLTGKSEFFLSFFWIKNDLERKVVIYEDLSSEPK